MRFELGGARNSSENELVAANKGRIEAIEALGMKPTDLISNAHVATGPEKGMEKSCRDVLKVFELLDSPPAGKVFRGSPGFLDGDARPVQSPGVDRLIELASGASAEDPLYVVCIAAPPDVVSAPLLAPEIIRNIVVIWDAGYPTQVRGMPGDSLSLEEDLLVSQILFKSGVPLAYMPGFYIAQLLGLSLPDMESWARGRGSLGEGLFERYVNNPLFPFNGIDPNHLMGRVWIIWDMINIAWLIRPDWVPTKLVDRPRLGDDKQWYFTSSSGKILEAYSINRNEIFIDFFARLDALY